MPTFFATVLGKAITIGVVVLVLLISVKSCTGSQQKAAQARQDARGATATAETAQDAAKTVIERSNADLGVDELVRQTAMEIDNAKTPQDAGRAARAAICRLPNYRADPSCKLQ